MKFTSHVRHIVSILSFCGMVVQQRKYEPFFFFLPCHGILMSDMPTLTPFIDRQTENYIPESRICNL